MRNRESWLEIGLATLFMAMIGGAGLAVVARAAESARRRQRHALPPPDVGTVSPRSHRNIASSAAR
jgi:hypothetical protein